MSNGKKITTQELFNLISDGFNKVNVRLDHVETRLDNIVKKNNLVE